MTDAGRYTVATHWRTRWTVIDQSWNPPRQVAGPYDQHADAQAEADRRNTPPAPTQRTQQASLFDQEATA